MATPLMASCVSDVQAAIACASSFDEASDSCNFGEGGGMFCESPAGNYSRPPEIRSAPG